MPFLNPPACTFGFGWDSFAGCCVLNLPFVPPCPPNNYWNGKGCVSLPPLSQCGPASFWNGESCVPVRELLNEAVCRPGYYWDGLKCKRTIGNIECLEKFKWDVESAGCSFCGCKDTQIYDVVQKGCLDRSLKIESPELVVLDGSVCVKGGAILNAAGQSLATSGSVLISGKDAFIQGSTVAGLSAPTISISDSGMIINTPGSSINIPQQPNLLDTSTFALPSQIPDHQDLFQQFFADHSRKFSVPNLVFNNLVDVQGKKKDCKKECD